MEIQLAETLSQPSQSLQHCNVSRLLWSIRVFFLSFHTGSWDVLAPHRKGTVTRSVNSEGLINSLTRPSVGPRAAVMWAAPEVHLQCTPWVCAACHMTGEHVNMLLSWESVRAVNTVRVTLRVLLHETNKCLSIDVWYHTTTVFFIIKEFSWQKKCFMYNTKCKTVLDV